ncbi:MAG TPA: ADP-ribosylglycohydrolase family protein [Thermoleophilia bacterium]|nr:ADP-ribosylglycohydrolase family protein [Thermoleophilia bacterium]
MPADLEVEVLRDRIRGSLLGVAVGDALGAPADFLTPDQIVERYGLITEMLGGGCHDLQPGQTTDATEMMLCLAESLAAIGGFDAEDVMDRYLAWFESVPLDMSLAVRTALLSYRSGTPWDLASRRAHEILGGPTAGNGSLMRCAPVAMRYLDDTEMRHAVSQRESTLTHFDRLAGTSCVAFNDLLVAALHGELAAQLPVIADAMLDEDRRVSATLREAAAAEPEEIQNSAFVLDTLCAAVWAVLRTDSFEDALVLSVNLGNDADTVSAVTGALAGAVYGEAGIPPRWLAPLCVRERVVAVADRLVDLIAI